MKLNKLKWYHLGLVILLIVSLSLRFINLGYSEFQDDEKKTQIKPIGNETTIDFLLKQKKGPMQFLVAHIPYTYFKDNGYVNEFAIRLPFTIANLLAVFILYALILKLTKSHWAAFIVALLFSVNGFVIGFSRIAQYQNLNLLFSFSALYFLADLKYGTKNFQRNMIIGTILMCLSLLSHWDAIFYTVPVLYFVISFLFRKDVENKYKIRSVIAAIIIFGIMVIPFLWAYIFRLTSENSSNLSYLSARIGTTGSDLLKHKFIFELYNPVITLWLYIVGIILALISFKKTWPFILWFAVNLTLIKLFMVTPKTHIYNYVIVASILTGLGFYYVKSKLWNKLGLIITANLLVLIGLLYKQSYLIFVDHTKEYPYDEKQILWHKNPVYLNTEVITFGFPHYRDWKKVDSLIDPNCQYITNEAKGISQIYVKADYGENRTCYYLVVVKRPFNTPTQNAIYAQARDSKLIYQYIVNGETLTKVYKIK